RRSCARKDDRACAALEHVEHGFARAKECATNTDSPGLFELLRCGLGQAFADRTACVRNEDFDGAELLPYFVEGGRDLFRIRNVCRDCQRVPSNFGSELTDEFR